MTDMTRGTDDAMPNLETANCAFYYYNVQEYVKSRNEFLKKINILFAPRGCAPQFWNH